MTLSLSAFSALTLVCCITREERAIYLRRRTCANNDENNYVPRAPRAYNGACSRHQEWGSESAGRGFLCLQTRLLNRVATTHFELLPLPFSSDCFWYRQFIELRSLIAARSLAPFCTHTKGQITGVLETKRTNILSNAKQLWWKLTASKLYFSLRKFPQTILS